MSDGWAKVLGAIIGFVIVVLIVVCGVGGHSISEVPAVLSEVPNDIITIINNIGGSSSSSSGSSSSSSSTSSDAKTAKAISQAIEPSNSAVRSLALSAIKSSSSGSYNIAQVCDVYDYLYKHWTYVSDPNTNSDYYAKASESAKLMKGDCDDFAILMASCIEAIGGTARVTCAYKSNGGGHAFAEVYMTNKESSAKSLTKSVSKRYGGKSINYRITTNSDGTKDYWLNLDWSANHPGGEYYTSNGKNLVVRSNGYYYRTQ